MELRLRRESAQLLNVLIGNAALQIDLYGVSTQEAVFETRTMCLGVVFRFGDRAIDVRACQMDLGDVEVFGLDVVEADCDPYRRALTELSVTHIDVSKRDMHMTSWEVGSEELWFERQDETRLVVTVDRRLVLHFRDGKSMTIETSPLPIFLWISTS